MISKFISNLGVIPSNMHVSVPVLVVAGLAIAGVWFPQYKAKFDETEKLLLCYGVLGAANSSPKDKDQTQNENKP
jgi:hypothetical protein